MSGLDKMKVLVVGGTGLTGAHVSLYLREQGHEVTIVSRSAPGNPVLADFDHVAGDYIAGDLSVTQLEGFDALVFAAGADIRQLPEGVDEEHFFQRANAEAIPLFFERARAAGIARAVYIGTYYPQVVPDKIESSPYVRSRYLADQAVRELNNASFNVCSLNPPFLLGYVPGVKLDHLKVLVDFAAGRLQGVPLVAPAGGVNHMSSLSLSEAILGALQRGEGGRGYLVGDQNLSWKTYLEMFFDSAGNPVDLEVTDQEHPLFPDVMLYAGRNAVVDYEPENGELGYSRNRVREAVDQLVDAFS